MYYPNPQLITKMIHFYIKHEKDESLDDLWGAIRNKRLLKIDAKDHQSLLNYFFEKENFTNVTQVAK